MKIFGLNHLCLLCQITTSEKCSLCKDCEKILPKIPLDHTRKYNNKNLIFNQIISLFEYRFPINYLVTQLKFQQDLACAKLLGDLMATYLPDFYTDNALPDILIPVPLHPKRLRERGFNQALEMARPISNTLKIPIEKFAFRRIKDTLPQSLLPKKTRLENLKNAFSLATTTLPFAKDKHVAIIDDVLTTGETLENFALTLKKQGIQKIDAWCFAQAI